MGRAETEATVNGDINTAGLAANVARSCANEPSSVIILTIGLADDIQPSVTGVAVFTGLGINTNSVTRVFGN